MLIRQGLLCRPSLQYPVPWKTEWLHWRESMCHFFSIFEVCQNPLGFCMLAPLTCSGIFSYKQQTFEISRIHCHTYDNFEHNHSIRLGGFKTHCIMQHDIGIGVCPAVTFFIVIAPRSVLSQRSIRMKSSRFWWVRTQNLIANSQVLVTIWYVLHL